MYQITTLDNGLRILSAPMPYAHSVSVAFFLAAGSRYENPEESGLSHFVEHLCFKGTRQRPSAKDISEAIERVGGVLNGGTDKEITVYWCKVARPHFELGVDILSDMLRNSLFDVSEIDKERNVINEEISMSWDSPGHRTELLLDEVLWPGNALGRDVAGSRETLPNINKDLLVDYVTRQYLPNTMVVGVAGAIEHQEVVSVIDRYLRDWEKGSPRLLHPAADTQEEPRLKVEYKDTEQAHLCLAVRGIPLLHPDRYALDLLNVILGEGMSSRL
ncbi:MAG: pitrilysin family protein, partial [Dehalococcoidia bacterium]|nr:pitrilysin family protein [Dehalococcoidia bacterium]